MRLLNDKHAERRVAFTPDACRQDYGGRIVQLELDNRDLRLMAALAESDPKLLALALRLLETKLEVKTHSFVKG